MILGGLGHEGGALTSGVSALLKETLESFLTPFSTWRDPRELPHPLLPTEHMARRPPSVIQKADPHQTLNILVPWSWSSQPPDPWEINVHCLRHPVHSVLLQQPKWTKTSGLQRPQVICQITPCLSSKIYLFPPSTFLTFLQPHWPFSLSTVLCFFQHQRLCMCCPFIENTLSVLLWNWLFQFSV